MANREQRVADDQAFHDWFMNAPGAVCIVSLTGEVLVVNEQACLLHGRGREGLIGRSMLEMVSEKTRDAMARDFERIVAGELEQLEIECLQADGEIVPVEIRVGRTHYDGDEVLLIHAWDISDRRQVEARFRESERLLARSQEIASLGSYSRDLLTQQVTASTEYYRIFDFDPAAERITHFQQVIDRVHEEDRQRFVEYIQRVTNEGVTYPLEYRIVQSDGEIRHILGQSEVIFDQSGTPVRVIGTVQDITSRKLTELRMGENDARLRLMIRQIPAVLWTTDEYLRITSSEGRGLELLQLQPGELIGKTLYEYFSTDDSELPAIKASLDALDGKSTTLETDIDNMTLQGFFEPLRNADGQIVGTIGLSLDVTERKRAEQRQQLMLKELDHRVKNNLAAILSISDQSLAKSETLEEFDERFTARIVAMSRTHSFLASTHWEGADLRQIIEQTIAPYNMPDDRRAFTEGPAVSLPPVTAMAVCMAIHELATNAFKYGALASPEGRVHIHWQLDDQTIHLQWSESGGPPVPTSPTRGFGTRLIEKGIAYQFGGKASLDFAPTGVQCTLTIPVKNEH